MQEFIGKIAYTIWERDVVQTAKTSIIGFAPKLWFGAVFEGTVV